MYPSTKSVSQWQTSRSTLANLRATDFLSLVARWVRLCCCGSRHRRRSKRHYHLTKRTQCTVRYHANEVKLPFRLFQGCRAYLWSKRQRPGAEYFGALRQSGYDRLHCFHFRGWSCDELDSWDLVREIHSSRPDPDSSRLCSLPRLEPSIWISHRGPPSCRQRVFLGKGRDRDGICLPLLVQGCLVCTVDFYRPLLQFEWISSTPGQLKRKCGVWTRNCKNRLKWWERSWAKNIS